MVWGQAYGEVPSSAALDPFAVAERDTRAMVSAGWWLGTPPIQRLNLIAGRMLALPDGTCWLFGAWGRWYRWTPADGQWYLCPPPRPPITRMSARPLQLGMPVPRVPPDIVPTGPDLAHDPPPALAFVDVGIRPEVTSRVRATVESAADLSAPDYPHRWDLFSSTVPGTVAATWGVMLWCATAPVFDSRLDGQLLGVWSSYRAHPLPDIDGPRWLTPPPLASLIGLYTERLRAGRVDSAVVVLRTMWAMAGALREDSRFQPRADALIAMLGVTLQNPTVDYGALPYGDQAVVQQWLTRCAPVLAPALRAEASAGEHFRNAYYDLALAVDPISGDPAGRGYVEPRLIAAALLAADLAVVRPDISGQVIGWLDPQAGEATRAMLIQRDHPLRRFWPEGDRMPRTLRERMDAAGPSVRNTLLATMYGVDLAWCRLGGGIPARPRGFPSSVAILAEIIGPERATSAAAGESAAGAADPGQGAADEGSAGDDAMAGAMAVDGEDDTVTDSQADDAGQVTMLDSSGEDHPGDATMLDPLDRPAGRERNTTYVDWTGGTLADVGPIPNVAPSPVRPGPLRTRMIEQHAEPERPGTRIMSGAMVRLAPVDFAGVAEDIEPVLRPPRDVDGFLRGLEEMIGLAEVKRAVGELVAEARMAADRAARGLPPGLPSRHLIFLGRPGTGKATVAGLIGGIYAALNLLDSGHLVMCGARDFAGGDTAAKVEAHVDRAAGGVLLIEDAYLLDRMSAAVDELSRLMAERRDEFMVICASMPDEMEGFLLANPGFCAEFGAIIEFREPTERQLVQLFSRLAERDLYMLDEELRVELLDRFAGMRGYPGFAFADTVRRLFDQIVVRQAARLAGARVDPAAVARLSIRDLPESEGEELLQQLHPNRRG